MKPLCVLYALCALTSCATQTRVAPGMPAVTAVRSARDLAGTYSNVGRVHSPDANGAFEAYLDVALGAASYPEAFRGSVIIRAEEDAIVLLRVDGDRILRRTSLRKDREYRETAEGIEMTRLYEGSGPEGVFSMKIATRIVIGARSDGSLVLRAYDDIHAMALWPYRDSRVIWYEFEKRANQPPEPTVMSVTPRAGARVAPATTVAHL